MGYTLAEEVHVDVCLEVQAASERVKTHFGRADELCGSHGESIIRFESS